MAQHPHAGGLGTLLWYYQYTDSRVTISPTVEFTFNAHEDIMGSASYYTKQTGAVYEEHIYDAWGGVRWSTGYGVNDGKTLVIEPNYTGHSYDPILKIYHAEARFYDGKTRQWMASDPIKSGLNWYQYVESNPTTYFDPTGLAAVGVGTIAVIGEWLTSAGATVFVVMVGKMFSDTVSDVVQQWTNPKQDVINGKQSTGSLANQQQSDYIYGKFGIENQLETWRNMDLINGRQDYSSLFNQQQRDYINGMPNVNNQTQLKHLFKLKIIIGMTTDCLRKQLTDKINRPLAVFLCSGANAQNISLPLVCLNTHFSGSVKDRQSLFIYP